MGQVSLLCMLVQTLLVMVEQESTLISGYHSVPCENDYWSTSEDLENTIFSKTMRRDRFRSLKRHCHVADNNNLVDSKSAIMLLLLEML